MIITAFYAGLLGLLLIGLSLRVALVRLRRRIPLGNGEDRDLERRVRAHGNFVEYAAFALLQLGLLETLGTAPLLLHLNGAAFTLGRVMHAWGLSRRSGASAGRMAGIMLTWVAILVMAVMLLLEAVLRLWLRS
jgi:uncharacterized protein